MLMILQGLKNQRTKIPGLVREARANTGDRIGANPDSCNTAGFEGLSTLTELRRDVRFSQPLSIPQNAYSP
jgi:hypothetical protein